MTDMEKDWYSVLIQDGPYEGVSYKYGTISMFEEEDQGRLQFDYDIINRADHNSDELESSKEFTNVIGDILVEVIQHAIDNDNFRIGKEEKES